MAFPFTLNPARPAGADAVNDPASTIDNQIRALKQLLADLFGIPVDPTSLTAAIFSTTAGGIPSLAQPATHRIASVLDKVTADTTITGVTEGTLYTFSVPANTLGTSGTLHFTALVNVTIVADETYRLKYGTTTLATIASAAAGEGTIEAWLSADGATNAQRGVVRIDLSGGGLTAAGSAAEVSTGALNFVITSDGNNAGDSVVMRYALLEWLP